MKDVENKFSRTMKFSQNGRFRGRSRRYCRLRFKRTFARINELRRHIRVVHICTPPSNALSQPAEYSPTFSQDRPGPFLRDPSPRSIRQPNPTTSDEVVRNPVLRGSPTSLAHTRGPSWPAT